MMTIDSTIYNHLCIVLNTPSLQICALSGGSINHAVKITTAQQSFICKINSATKFPHLFEKEAAGLNLINCRGNVKTPKLIDLFETNSYQVLVLEWIEPSTPAPPFWKSFGKSLATLLGVTQSVE